MTSAHLHLHLAKCPPEVWARISKLMRPDDFLQLSVVTRCLLEETEQQAVWCQFCHSHGFAVSLDELGEVEITQPCPTNLAALQRPGALRWRQLFKVNAIAERFCAQAGTRPLFAHVRLGCTELRVPLPLGGPSNGDSNLSFEHQWLNAHGWHHPTVLGDALSQLLIDSVFPFRLRESAAGRAGALIKRAHFVDGLTAASAVVEWPLGKAEDGRWLFLLPPYEETHFGPGRFITTTSPAEIAMSQRRQSEGNNTKTSITESSNNSSNDSIKDSNGATGESTLLPGPHPWSRSQGWIVKVVLDEAWDLHTGTATSSACPPSTPPPHALDAGRQSSPCKEVTRWLHIGASLPAEQVTLRALCEELRAHLLSLGWAAAATAAVLPASTRKLGCPVEDIDMNWKLWEDLRWTQGETLHLACASSSALVLFSRDALRRPRRLLRSRSRPRRPSSACGDFEVQPQSCNGNSNANSNSLNKSNLGNGNVSGCSSTANSSNLLRPLLPTTTATPTAATANSAAAAASEAEVGVAKMLRLLASSKPGEQDKRFLSDTLSAKRGQPKNGGAASNNTCCSGRSVRRGRRGGLVTRRTGRRGTSSSSHEESSQRILRSTRGVRQFEFHPTRPGTLLAGHKDGRVIVVDYEADAQTHSFEMGAHPVLGLSWLHTQPQWAVAGSSHSGNICLIRYDEDKPGLIEHVRFDSFPNLSSLSISCTDDYFMTSGFCLDTSLYDVVTGRVMSTFRGLHRNFINIQRFSNTSPHIFATASFDRMCKIWDLREPLVAQRPAQSFAINTLNVTCAFSPDDRHILCSGVDSMLKQFSLRSPSAGPSADDCGTSFPLPSLNSSTNYRRSQYVADGSVVVTGATHENLVRLYASQAPHDHLGTIDLRGCLRRMKLQECGAAVGTCEEYVQSVRCHPRDPSTLGILLATVEPCSDYALCMAKLPVP